MCGSRFWIYLVITYSSAAPNLFFILTAETGITLFHFLVTFFFSTSDLYCLCISPQCCSLSIWPVFTTSSHLKVTYSRPHGITHHAHRQSSFKTRERASPSVDWRLVGAHSLHIQQHPLSVRCCGLARLRVAGGHRLLILLPPLSPNPLPH